ncbi:DUF2007 domain-containing protein [Oleiagrimonas sp. C23AA]|uniref:putative signal transducing protein n=1 Tax=Oleiagrimonas sp. C23AA TaxID=2719047 RepID=UPI00142491BD|nr:DUF2007 domain-containing protein [Oleiagrimonas sp. C23AA]NII09987.1 DUF2007 domain-containing protein [Oleiagrimonas sp. C23AA]
MRIVYLAETMIDAHLVKNALEQAGLPAFVLGEYLTGAVGDLPARDYVRVAVPDSCEEAATPIVQEVERSLVEAREAVREDDDRAGEGFDGATPFPA